MGWAETRKAIQNAIVAASDYPPEKVFWRNDNADQPAFDFIDLDVSSSTSPAIDGLYETYDASRPAGQGIMRQVIGCREVQLDIEIYTAATVTVAGKWDALAVGERIRSKLRFGSVRGPARRDGGVSFLDIESTISYVPAIVATKFRGRALFPIRCNVPAEALAEYTGYIAAMNGTLTVHGGTPDPDAIDYSAP